MQNKMSLILYLNASQLLIVASDAKTFNIELQITVIDSNSCEYDYLCSYI